MRMRPTNHVETNNKWNEIAIVSIKKLTRFRLCLQFGARLMDRSIRPLFNCSLDPFPVRIRRVGTIPSAIQNTPTFQYLCYATDALLLPLCV